MIKKIAFITLLTSISFLQAMSPGAAAGKAAAEPKNAASMPQVGVSEEQKVREFITLMADFIMHGNEKPELKDRLREALRVGVERDLKVVMVNPLNVPAKKERVSVSLLFDRMFIRARSIVLEKLERYDDNLLRAIKVGNEAKKVAKKAKKTVKQVIESYEFLQRDIDAGVFDRVDELQAIFLQHDGHRIFFDDEDQEQHVAPVQPTTPVVHEVRNSLAENVNQFLRNADASCKVAITHALAHGADREVVVQALVAQEAKLKSLTRSWDEYQHAEAGRLEARVTDKVLQERITTEQAIALLKEEHEKAQERIQNVVGARIQQLRDLLESEKEDGGDKSLGGTSDTVSSESASSPHSENVGEDSNVNLENINGGSATKPGGRDAGHGTHSPPNTGSWSDWFSYKKAAALIGVAIVAAIVGKKYYDRDKKNTRVV